MVVSSFPVTQDILTECTLYTVVGAGVEEPSSREIFWRHCCMVGPSSVRPSSRASSDLMRWRGCGPSPSNISGCPVFLFTVARTVWPLLWLWYCRDIGAAFEFPELWYGKEAGAEVVLLTLKLLILVLFTLVLLLKGVGHLVGIVRNNRGRWASFCSRIQ